MDEASNKRKTPPKNKKEDSKDEHEKYPGSKTNEATTKEVRVVEPSSLVGRFQKAVFSYKSNTASKVSRSGRLVCYGN
jgi:hypothetical protein